MEQSQCSSGEPNRLHDKDNSNPSEAIKNTDLTCQISHNAPSSALPGVRGRVRLYSESQVYTVSRWEEAEWQDGGSAEDAGGSAEGTPFRGRSQSAPAALWAAKKYGRQLRRMSDEFDTWLDRGELKRGSSPRGGSTKQTHRGWFSFLWSPKEEEGRE